MAGKTNRSAGKKDNGTRPMKLARPVLGREAFAKISEVEGIRLSDDMKQAFAQFDREGLPHEKRRRAIIGRFKRAAK